MARLGRSQPFKPLIIRKPRSAFLHAISEVETVTVHDTRGVSLSRSLSNTLTLVDSVATSFVLGLPLSEVLTITDNVAKSISRSMTDTLAVTGSVYFSTTKFLSESLTIVDSLNTLMPQFFYETITVTGTMFKTITKGLSEAFTFLDTLLLRKAARGMIRGISRVSSFMLGRSNNQAVQRGKSAETGTKHGSHL